MTRFILVRHGQTAWNRDERFRGRFDLLLNETGLRQAYAAAMHLKDCPVSAIYASPLKRTILTAQVIANQVGLRVIPFEGLIDIDFGKWQGLSAGEAAKQDGELFRAWLEEPHKVRFPDGESLDDVRKRVTAGVKKLADRHTDQTVLLVSHMVVCRVLLCAMLGLDNSHYWQVGQDVCAINAFDVRDGASSVTVINDTCHLRSQGLG
jgi:broad specificity phosphatase PhoE